MSAKTHRGRFSFANLSQLHVVEAHAGVFFTLEPGSLVLPAPHEDQYFTVSAAVGGCGGLCAVMCQTQALRGSAGLCSAQEGG